MGNDFRPRYLEKLRGRWRYRRIIPEGLRAQFPSLPDGRTRTKWVRHFRRGMSDDDIAQDVKRLSAEHDELIARARAGEVMDVKVIAAAEANARASLADTDKVYLHGLLGFLAEEAKGKLYPDAAALLNALEHGGTYQPETMTLAMARAKRGGTRSEKPIDQALATFAPFGGDKDVRQIDEDEVSDYIKAELARPVKASTVGRRLDALHSLCNFAFRKLKITKPNPFGGHKDELEGSQATSSDCLPFNRPMLAAIDHYLATSNRLGDETRNIMRMMRNTGAGPAEIGGLVLADVSLDGEIPFINLRFTETRRLKTRARPRRVPLVGVALDAARDAVSLAMIRAKGKSADDVLLFASFGKSGRGAESISAKLNKAVRVAGVPRSRRLVPTSYKHCMKEALRCAGINDHVQRRVLGHAGEGVADRYGSPQLRLSEARNAIAKALEYLGDVDATIYSDKERMPD